MDRKTNRSSRFFFSSASPQRAVAAPLPRHTVTPNNGAEDQLTKGLRYEAHRPRTPPNVGSGPGAAQGKGVRAARNRGALADIFPEAAAAAAADSTADDNGRKSTTKRKVVASPTRPSDDHLVRRSTSHELSWTSQPEGGDGVVDRMLMSFGQLDDSVATGAPTIVPVVYTDPDSLPQISSRSTSTTRRPRGHTYSSSTSSGIAAQSFDTSGRRNKHSKNKSITSANIHINEDGVGGAGSSGIRTIDPHLPKHGGAAARTRRYSKSSVVSGLEETRPSTVASRKQKQHARRSASFDQSFIRSAFAANSIVLRDPITMAEYDDINAAPEPSVRPGPRRLGETGPGSSLGSQTIRGRDGGKTLTGLRKQGVSPQRIDSALASDDGRNSSAAGYREAPQISSSRQPVLTTGYQATAFSTNIPSSKEKEKGGFFKRMFGGGSKQNNQTALGASPGNAAQHSSEQLYQQQQQQQQQHSAQARGRPIQPEPAEDRQQSTNSRAQSSVVGPQNDDRPPTPQRSKSEAKEGQPTLTKKSSFFRRRKKSIASAAPAVPKLPDSSTWPHQGRDPSPTSSLRNVMNPYLASRPGTRAGGPVGPRDDRRPGTSSSQRRPGSKDDMVVATPRAVETRPRRSTSKSWRERPSFRRGAHGDSSSSMPQNDPSRNDADASEVSDADFISAKSHVNSPVDDQPPDLFRPPAPTGAPPAVPKTSAAENARSGHTTDPGKTPTYPPPSGGIAVSTPETDDVPRPTDEDYEVAYKLFRFNSETPVEDTSLPMAEGDICAWLGEAGPNRARVRKAYLEQFDWREISVLAALRRFCEHVRLKGETQQVDRVLEGIAVRWTECNPSHGFKALDVVHTICYSLLLLNTDLHIADIDNRMTRGQFIKNTMPTITKVLDDAAPDAFKGASSKRNSVVISSAAPVDVSKQSTLDIPKSPHSPVVPKESGTVKLTIRRNSNEFQKNKYRLSARPSDNHALETLLGNTQSKEEKDTQSAPSTSTTEDCGPLVKQPFFGGKSAWESQVETVLKNFYTSIQKQRLPLQGADSREWSRAPSSVGQNASGTPVRRTPSVTSKQSDGRGRNLESRGTVGGTASSRWTSRHRGRPRIYAASSISVDDDMSMGGMSPSASSLWSKHSFGRTQTSMSVQSFGSEAPGQEAYQQSIGFANALSQAIIREEGGGLGDDSDGEAIKAAPLLEDESLGLYGAPWAKEGIVKHKHHLEAVDKKAKERAWTECFAVIEKGWLRLFRFNSSKSASLRSRTLRAAMSGVGSSSQSVRAGSSGGKMIVGGGNWMDNALPLGRFLLRQTIASALPPPGYSKSRPHVWALSLPNGAVHLFQANTPEIVREYVSCANYWSARLSKEPLTGAVGNMEYGWGEMILGDVSSNTPQPPGSRSGSRDGPGQPSSLADAFNMKRQRSTSASSSATQIPGVPRSGQGRGFSIGTNSRPPSAMHSARPSLQTSIRSSFETTSSAVVRPRMPGDHAKIADWTPPPQSMVASALLEVDQLRVLSDYVSNIKKDLEKHNELRSAIQQAYNPRHPNYAKAMSNFEKKSAYLLREIVKFSTYVETLQTAQTKKEEVYRERDQRKRELEEERGREAKEKVETAEELRRELSKSDLRKAASYDDDYDDDVPEVPEVPAALMNMIT